MNAQEILSTLKKLGKPQTAAIYKRHGSGDNVFGVLTSEIAKLQKKLKVDHVLAMELWKSGNAEARVLALQIADPEKLTRADADSLLKDGPVHFVGSYLAGLLARSPIAKPTMRAWMKSPDESRREMGYGLLGFRLKDDPDSVSDAEAEKILATIEKDIHRSPNWARYAMNVALISRSGSTSPRSARRRSKRPGASARSRLITARRTARHPMPPPTSRRLRNGSAALNLGDVSSAAYD